MILSWEKWLSLKHFSENATSTPDIYFNVILLPREHDLGRAIVSCRDIASHLRILNTGKAEIADLKIAVLVDKDIAGF